MILIVYTTHASIENAQSLVQQLINEHLIACANIFPIQSTYFWQAALQQEDEVVAILKTRPEYLNKLETAIKKLHTYELPCIVSWQAQANDDYEKWVYEQTQSSNKMKLDG